MSQLIETLNHTSAARTFFYCVVAIFIIATIADALGNIFRGK